MKIALSGFQGANRALHPKLLPEAVGVSSLNQKPGRGDLRPWKNPLTVATIPAGAKAIYRMGRDVASDNNYWLSWDKDVHVSQGFETEDIAERTYYTGDGAPKVTNTELALAGHSSNWWEAAPNLTPIGAWDASAFKNNTFTDRVGSNNLLVVNLDQSQPTVIESPIKSISGVCAKLQTPIAPAGAWTWCALIDIKGYCSILFREPNHYLLIQDGQWFANGPSGNLGSLGYSNLSAGLNFVSITGAGVLYLNGQRCNTLPPGFFPSGMDGCGMPGYFPGAIISAIGIFNGEASKEDLDVLNTKIRAALSYNQSGAAYGLSDYPMAARDLGVPQPQGALIPTVNAVPAPSGSADAQMETVFYVYTYVSDWGSEGMPSKVSLQIEKRRADHVTLTGFLAPQAGNYGINRMRIYRTQANSGGADFYFMKEVLLGTQTVVDDGSSLGEVMATANWSMPPANLKNLTSLWNGMLAGISGNAVRFCEAYVPYAWPESYDAIPPDGTPVALGVFGQNLLVLTTGRPLLLSGSSPDSMDQQPLEIPQGCVASRSVVSMGSGVAWSSNDGLCWYGSGGARILTAGIMTREDWQALSPSSIEGCMYEGLYFGSYDNGEGRKGFLIDPNNSQGIYFLDAGYEAMHFDELQDQLYVVSGSSVQRWDAGLPMAATFKSKVFKTPYPTNFSCAELVADSFPVTVRVFADGALVHAQVLTQRGPFRLPSGFMASDWQVEIVTTGAVQGLVLANNMSELREV